MSAYLKNHIENLKATAAALSNDALNKRHPSELDVYKPLTQQITELMHSLPEGIKNKPWSMRELLLHLKGKYKDRPHTQHVGEALKKLGWTQKRLWGKQYQGLRLWLPPK